MVCAPMLKLQSHGGQARLELQSMTFTDHELELLVDSITWELDFLESYGWHESPRHQTLTELQARIQLFLSYQ